MRVRVSEPCFIDNRYYAEDSEFEYEGKLATFMTVVGGEEREPETDSAPAVPPPFKRGPGRPRKDSLKPPVTFAEIQKGATPQV